MHGVEAAGTFSSKLEMLNLVLANRDVRRSDIKLIWEKVIENKIE